MTLNNSLSQKAAKKQAEQTLKASEERYRAFVQNSSEAIWCLELDQPLDTTLPMEQQIDWLYAHASIVECNKAMAVMHSYKSREEMLGLQLSRLLPRLSPDNLLLIQDFIRNNYQIRERESVELGHGAEVRHCISNLTGIVEESALRRIWGVKRDISDLKRVQEEIRQLNAELEQRVEERTRELHEAQKQLVRQERLVALGQLAGSVSHELRNPLGVISNAVYYLKHILPNTEGKIKQYLDMIDYETHLADKIITDLLGFARIQSVDRERMAMPALVEKSLTRFPVSPQVQLAIEIPADLPAVYADQQQIIQVLGNLITNACQAMPEGGNLTIQACKQEQMVAVAVTDTGTGITSEHMENLFEPLFTTKPKGIGLGLAISKKLIEANGGQIDVKSEVGKGSTFTLYVPIYARE